MAEGYPSPLPAWYYEHIFSLPPMSSVVQSQQQYSDTGIYKAISSLSLWNITSEHFGFYCCQGYSFAAPSIGNFGSVNFTLQVQGECRALYNINNSFYIGVR